jgi:heterotetrameric sarcosine oxidase gamma subunit
VIDVTITPMPPAPLHALEIWSNAQKMASRFAKAKGFALPPMGKADGNDALTLIRFEPTVWLCIGDPAGLAEILGDGGSITAIGGGIVRLRLTGKGWRRLLMEGGVFDAENPSFSAGCSAATIIDHVNVRLHVVSDDVCDAFVPLSYSHELKTFWQQAIPAP